MQRCYSESHRIGHSLHDPLTLFQFMMLLAVTLSGKFVPDTCTKGPGDWNPIGSAEALSAFCGIFAGFVFSGVVMVIGQKNPAGGDGHASRGLRLLLPSFFGLAIAAYLYALTSGELVCKRALVEQLFAGAILAADAAVVITGLAWLLLAYERNAHGEVRFFRGLILVAAIFVMLMLAVSSVAFHNTWTERTASSVADWVVWGTFAVLVAVVVLLWHKPVPPAPSGAPANWSYEHYLNRHVNVSAWLTLIVSAVLATASAYVVGVPYDELNLPIGLVYAMSEAALVVPALIILGAMRAVPRA
ncbi:hypothetical protein [Streptomyces sp. NPDC008141]|uniref:hypothetical protein n=1 Tax=Streptomyces sp. NPDC008141 TaxID=3364815 RepID=UPI0036E6F137